VIFSSAEFFVFFVIYFSLHLVVPRRYRIYLIILGSTVFYAWWKVEYAWLPYTLMGTAFFGGHWIDRASEPTARRRRTAATLVVLFIPLVLFKYTDFIYRDVLGPFIGTHANLLDLPLRSFFRT
jgi:alginate O-acetyltransferase complex protein AlgI